MSTEDINSFIDDVVAGEMNSAKDKFNDLIGAKLDTAIDQKRVDVAGSMFSAEETDETEGDLEITDELEGLDEIDFDEDDDDSETEE